ncbi:MAG: Crp/Fnr family transcriptional regulator [Bacteroidota bacterium]
MHPVRAYIHQYQSLQNEEWEEILPCLERKEYPANHTLLREGQICEKLYFLEEGLIRFYTLRDGNDISKFFTLPFYCFTSQKSLSKQIPSREHIETLEPSILWEMDEKNAFGLLRLKNWNTFVRMLIQEVQDGTEEILEELQIETAESRYIRMLEEEPALIRRVPLKHLASYLGIAPQSLSRIRRKLLNA